jgi:rare lipoprotein A (peptidoglycan hydrolase)
VALLLGACGSTTDQHRTETGPSTALAQAHPQVIEPLAGGTGPPTAAQPSQLTVPASTPPGSGALPPATVTKAPSKGAPTDAEVRAAIAQFQLAVAQYRLYSLNFSNVLMNAAELPPGVWNTSIASVFTDYGHGVACGGILRVPELGVANKTLPCGTEVLFRYGGRAIRVPVIDRGPYIAGREWDLTGATAEALHFPGLGPIQWRIG